MKKKKISYRKIMVSMLKGIIENDWMIIKLDDEGNLTGEPSYGFITEDCIIGSSLETKEEDIKKYGHLGEWQKLPLGKINDMIVWFNKDIYDIEKLQRICDEIYDIIGDKYNLMTIELDI